MTVFKCKMCGGDLEVKPGQKVIECRYCGTQQTLPRLDDDRRANLYDRANHFRRNNEFDKAAGIYEQILSEDPGDAEAYWSRVLCRYGIEYVEDPDTHRRVPTVNRAQYTSIFDDEDYRAAIEKADGSQRAIYEQEASVINGIQKGILDISAKEEPFDVFICYKETDAQGRRTQDSVLANDLYHQLVQEGFKVFFSRITLEDKLGTAYEPYIFAALNSAKVMVVVGTRPEHFRAVWVRNEWSRYLGLIKAGAKKTLIPAYRDMDPYDLPEEFSHLQAQDMSKLGFMQDLIRGIKKIVNGDAKPKAASEISQVASGGATAGTTTLLKRAFMFLEDGEWTQAREYCERVLDADPECAEAYLGELLVELRIRNCESLQDAAEPFDGRDKCKKAVRFGDDRLRGFIEGANAHIRERNEQTRLDGLYVQATSMMERASTEDEYLAAAKSFEAIAGHKDAASQAQHCCELAEESAEGYRASKFESAEKREAEGTHASLQDAIRTYEGLGSYRGADARAEAAKRKLIDLRKREASKAKRIGIRTGAAAVVIIAVILVVTQLVIPEMERAAAYEEAAALGDTNAAITAFKELGDYKDSAQKAKDVQQAILTQANVGDVVYFGSYEQDNDTANGKEEIEWRVLAVENGKKLLVSTYALDSYAFNSDESKGSDWETSDLKTWLENVFASSAFSSEEKTTINDGPTCLSTEEAKLYFKSDTDRGCDPTSYAKSRSGTPYFWWLRSSGTEKNNAAIVYLSKGIIDEKGRVVDVTNAAVRPAVWVNL